MSSRNTAFHDRALAGVLLSPLKLAFSLALGLAALLLRAWILDWTFAFKVWPQGIERLRELLAHDLEHGVALAARQGAGAGAISWPANALYSIVFEATGIHDMGVQFASGTALSIPDTVMRRSYVSHRESIEAAMVGTQLLGGRAAIVARFAPLLLLLYAVGAADGFTQRAIRRACGGRESAGLYYHRTKYLQVAVLGLGGVGLLLWPGPVRWELCVPLGAVLFGGLASVQWAYYKKHMQVRRRPGSRRNRPDSESPEARSFRLGGFRAIRSERRGHRRSVVLSLIAQFPGDSAMADLLVRGVDEALVKALKERAGAHGRSAEAEHREILAEALARPRKRALAELLASIPDVGTDADFERVESEGKAPRVFD